jgi:ribulose 1,5-bisphosphate carboxylase large subunit-like protein
MLTVGGGAFGHKVGPKQGATSCRQGEEAWMLGEADADGDVSISDVVIEHAMTHEVISGAFLTLQNMQTIWNTCIYKGI